MNLFRRKKPSEPRDAATEETVYWAYRLLLGREPDPSGLAHFRQLTAKGVSVEELTNHFTGSEEYRRRQEEFQRRFEMDSRPVAVDLGGYQVFVRRTELDFGRGIVDSRKYEDHVRQVVRDYLREGDTVVDVGANVGVISFLAASLVGSSGRVFAVEPNPDNLQLLRLGLVANGFTNVKVLPYAASDTEAIYSLTGGTSNTHVVNATPDAEHYLAQSVILDDLLGHLPGVNFIKLDIEGHEPHAIRGLRETLRRCRPTILTEFNPRCLVQLQNSDPLAFANMLLEIFPRLRAISAFQDDRTFERADELMAFWERRDKELAERGLLPTGMLHFDLVATSGE